MRLEERFFYHPHRYPKGDWTRDPDVGDIFLTALDGTRLHGWAREPAEPTERTILFLHGNGGNIATRRTLLAQLSRIPACAFAIDYRGYGRSSGKPSEAGLMTDARAAWSYLTKTMGIAPEKIILFGESLGGAVAIALAGEARPGGLIVQSSFTSMPALVRAKCPWIKERWVRTQWRSLEKITSISCPKLFLHGSEDRLIPRSMRMELFAAAQEQKQLVLLPGAGHGDMEQIGGQEYERAICGFARGCSG